VGLVVVPHRSAVLVSTGSATLWAIVVVATAANVGRVSATRLPNRLHVEPNRAVLFVSLAHDTLILHYYRPVSIEKSKNIFPVILADAAAPLPFWQIGVLFSNHPHSGRNTHLRPNPQNLGLIRGHRPYYRRNRPRR